MDASKFFAAISITLLVTPAWAEPALGLPLRCTPGTDCWIANYVDVDPSEEAADFTCGRQTYDGHKGTDFALRDRAAMKGGVDVVAVTDGTVLRARDGMADEVELSGQRRRQLLKSDRACGNGIVMDHGDGWQTQYCHLRAGSVAVKPGEAVKAGATLGLVGQSGVAEFPHVHLAVMKDGRHLDPFTGAAKEDGCGRPQERLWRDPALPIYEPVAIYALGFASGEPDFAALKLDASPPATIDAGAPAMIFWATMYGLRAGDEVVMEIRDPGNGVFSGRKIDQQRTKARQFYFVGKRARGLKPGTWTGLIRVVRNKDSALAIEREKRVTVQVR